MPRLQLGSTMTSPPTSCATGPTDGRFFSPYPNYFSFGGMASIEQGRPADPTNTSNVYAAANLVDIGEQFVSQQAVNAINDFVPIETQVAWDQGATTSDAMDHSMGMPSPLSQALPMPLVPGISSFGPILNTWPMPPVQRRRPSAAGPNAGQRTSKKRKQSANGQRSKGDDNRTITTAGTTILQQASPEDDGSSSKDIVMTNSHDDRPSTTTMIQDDFGSSSSITIGYSQENPESPPQETASGSRLATQRARNRVAANKFRKKSKAAVADLEAVERGLRAQHEQLSMMARDLREEVLGLKNELLLHGNCDCAMIHQYLSHTARTLSLGRSTPRHKASQGDFPSVTVSSDRSSSGSK
ncbi:hypothetical protein VSDG_07663 [Cytospora chrysosperma]|uniref:BZIP domain-containing protein n=1 Tax=Cytospora chrysosperma TaxID=252740 RepID=A0A423VJ68_CYTCH|nr:hypothetical protein VSDG_07663 [Valsa sordida]